MSILSCVGAARPKVASPVEHQDDRCFDRALTDKQYRECLNTECSGGSGEHCHGLAEFEATPYAKHQRREQSCNLGYRVGCMNAAVDQIWGEGTPREQPRALERLSTLCHSYPVACSSAGELAQMLGDSDALRFFDLACESEPWAKDEQDEDYDLDVTLRLLPCAKAARMRGAQDELARRCGAGELVACEQWAQLVLEDSEFEFPEQLVSKLRTSCNGGDGCLTYAQVLRALPGDNEQTARRAVRSACLEEQDWTACLELEEPEYRCEALREADRNCDVGRSSSCELHAKWVGTQDCGMDDLKAACDEWPLKPGGFCECTKLTLAGPIAKTRPKNRHDLDALIERESGELVRACLHDQYINQCMKKPGRTLNPGR